MSDTPTPRSDLTYSLSDHPQDLLENMRLLESELTAANARVKQLKDCIADAEKDLSESQAKLEKQRLILVANQKIMDGAGETIKRLKAQLASAREDAEWGFVAAKKASAALEFIRTEQVAAAGLPLAATGISKARVAIDGLIARFPFRSEIDAAQGASPQGGKDKA